jgi:hypothetical protein
MAKVTEVDQSVEQLLTPDQTQFSTEEPLYEAVSLPTKPEVPVSASKTTTFAGLNRLQLILIGVGAVAFVLLIVALLASMMRRPSTVQQLEPTPSIQPEGVDATQQQIIEFKKNVQAADPSLDKLPLPPVDLELRLEK